MNFDDFKREIKLSYMQHPHDQREEELYSIVLSILRDNNLNKNRYSFRDIHQNPKKRNNVLYGISSNPDLAVYDLKLTDDRNFNQKNFIYGVVEIKAIGTTLNGEERTQLFNELVWFGRVLYTNGVHWALYEYDNTKIENKLKKIYDLNEEIVKLRNQLRNKKKDSNDKESEITEIENAIAEITKDINEVIESVTSNIDLDSLKRKDFDIWLCNKKIVFDKKNEPILPRRFPMISEKKYNELCQKLRNLNWKYKVQQRLLCVL